MVQAETEQRPHKVSFYVEKDKAKHVTETLSKVLEGRGVRYNDTYIHCFLFMNSFCM